MATKLVYEPGYGYRNVPVDASAPSGATTTPAASSKSSQGGGANGAYLSALVATGLTPILGPVLGTVIGGAANAMAGNAASSYKAAGTAANATEAYTAALQKQTQPEQPQTTTPTVSAPAQTAQKAQSAPSISINPVLDMGTDYTVLINKAIAAGDWEAAAQAEFLRNQKIGVLQSQGNTEYEKTYRYTTPGDTELPKSKPQGASVYANDWLANATDYTYRADPSLSGYNNAGNWIGGVVGKGALTYDPNIERAIINTDLYASSEGKEGYWTPQAGNEAAYRSGTYEGANLNPSQQLWSEEPIYISDQGQMDAINGQLAKMGLAAPAYAAAISTNAAQTAANPAAGSLTPAAAYAQGISATSDPGSPYMDLYDTAEERINALKREQVDALYKSIQANADRYGYQIGDVNTAADDSARQAYILSMQNRRALPEILAAQGQPLGGATETANLRLLTNYENDLNSINTARNQDVAEINRAIAALYDEGALQASNINAQYGQSLLDTYLDLGQADIAYRQAAEEAAKQERLASEQQERQAYLDTITRYSADYQAEINRLKALGYGDDYWKIQYLQAARQGKLNDIAAAEAAAAAELAEWERELQTIAYTKSLSGGSSSGSSLTAAQAMAALKSGVVTSEIIAAVDGAYGAGATEAVLKTLDTSNPYGLTEQEMAYAGADALSGSTYELEQEIDKLKSQIGQILQESDGKDKAKRLLAYYVDSGQISQTEANQILRDHGVSLSAIHISGR